MIEYRLALAERSTTGMGAEVISDVLDLVGEIANAGLQFTEILNDVGQLEFSLPLDHESVTTDNFEEGKSEIYLYRNDGGGEQLVFGGRLWTVDVEDWQGRFICYDFSHDLGRRVIHEDYAIHDEDVYEIVWDLVSATQARTNGALAITRDFTTRGKKRRFVRCLEERETVLEAIRSLADGKGSFDFRVTPDKKLQLFGPTRGEETTVTLNDENMSVFRHSRDATTMETVVGVIGPAEDCQIPEFYETTSANAATYGILDGTVDDTDIPDDKHREDKADEQLRLNEVPRFQPAVSMSTPLQEVLVEQGGGYDVGFFDVEVGDTVGVSTTSVVGPVNGFRDFNASFRVLSKTVDVQRIGLETVTYGLDQVIL